MYTRPHPTDEPRTAERDHAQPGLNRRDLLRTLAGGFAALGVAACRASAAKPTATPTILPTVMATPAGGAGFRRFPQYLPWVAGGNRQAGEIAQEPTLTPTPPKATATRLPPPPQATHTPTVTPFPPGPPSKLGIFVARNDPQIFDLVATRSVPVVKTLELDSNFAGQIKQTSPHTRVIGRIDLPQLELRSLDPITSARWFVDQLMLYANDPARRLYFDAWEAYNEPVPGNVDEMKRLSDFEAERTRLLGDRGIRSIVGNFGTGQPPMDLWEHFLPAIQVAKQYDGWLGLHEYSAPTIYHLTSRDGQGRYPDINPRDSGWLTLRYRHVYNQLLLPAGLDIPLIMTELGVDGLVGNRPGPTNARGWQHFQNYWAENGYGVWGPGAYVEQLIWYDKAMQQDHYVLGGCIYALAASQGWQSYDISGPVTTVLEQYLQVHSPA